MNEEQQRLLESFALKLNTLTDIEERLGDIERAIKSSGSRIQTELQQLGADLCARTERRSPEQKDWPLGAERRAERLIYLEEGD
jgi:hypothetical protein